MPTHRAHASHTPSNRPSDAYPPFRPDEIQTGEGPAPVTRQDAAAWFDSDPAPVFLVGPGAVLLDANPAGRRLLDRGSAVTLRNRGLIFAETDSHRAFLRTLGDVFAGRATSNRVVLRGNDGDWRRVDLLGSEPPRSNRVFVSFRCEPQAQVEIDPLLEAFGLTSAEGEILRHLSEGLSPKEIARRLSVSTNTVRAHLRTLYLKMRVRGIPGVIRQSMRLIH
jgi:DNA-binding CsgD family transcriptional regulator